MAPRGIRNNNPGNIRKSSDAWKGLAADQPDPEFFSFSEPRWGIRAAAKVLQTYQEVHGLRTLAEIINRWAPLSENDTQSYITAVSIWSGIEPEEVSDVMDYETVFRLLRAMVRMENGKPPEDRDDAWYEPAVYEQGLRLAGVSPGKPLSKSRTTKGAAVAGASMASSVAILTDTFGLPAEIAALLPAALSGASEQTVSIVLLVIGLAGAGYAIWARRDDKRMGRL